MAFKLITEHTLSKPPEYEAALEEFLDEHGNQLLTLHIDVKPELFSPSVYKRLINEWHVFRECTAAPIFIIEPHPDDKKWGRFIAPLGFEFMMRVGCTDSKSRRLFVSNKKRNDNLLQNREQR